MSPRTVSLLFRLQLAVASVAAMSLAAGAVYAQDDKDKDKDKDKAKDKDTSGDEEPPKPPPKKKAQPKADKPDDDRPDHDRMVGHFGVSWFGVSTIPLGLGKPGLDPMGNPIVVPLGGGMTSTTVSAPALGIRYWLSNTIGVDVGIGIGYNGGSVSSTVPSPTGTTTTSADKLGAFGFLLHGGLPIALATGKHISLQLTPETNIGFAHASVAPDMTLPNPPPSATLSGIRFDLGARIGGEVQFGFIGLPELALEGSIGAFFTYQHSGVSVGPSSTGDSSIGFTTASFKNPWDFFASVVAARYYF